MTRPSLVICAALAATMIALHVATAADSATPRIDRQAVVTRHNPHITSVDPWSPLTVGNGGFAFTADVTGLQTLYPHYQRNGIGLETQARWSWHSNPNPSGYTLADANRPMTAGGRTVLYPTNDRNEAGRWLRENPHTQPLPQIALDVDGGAAIRAGDITAVEQTLDLWTGILTSRFTIAGERVETTTVADPERDAVAVRIRSKLVGTKRLGVRVAAPRGYDIRTKNNPALDWTAPDTHQTQIMHQDDRHVTLTHARDDSRYAVAVSSPRPLTITTGEPHLLRARALSGDELELSIGFAPGSEAATPREFNAMLAASSAHWRRFWQSGAAIDFGGSRDPRAAELERRVVLSQYLTAVQFAGDFPPQESGLTISTWYGKHHTEMIWWHTAHFALWGRTALLEQNLQWFVRALPAARALAQSRQLPGVRWAKMIGPDDRESPGGNPLIVWNQPHPIHLAELVYRNNPTPATLQRYRELVLDTAACMAAMLQWDEGGHCYNLGPPLWIAQEIYDQSKSMNPTYELSYWVRALLIAQQWRERLGLGRDADWDARLKQIAPLPVKDGKYVAMAATPDTWDNAASRHDHPSFLMALGQLPGDGVDRATMRRTLDAVLQQWDWETKIWGWDYPMVAMTAARLGEPAKAVDILLFTQGPNNAYRPNGHCPQRGDLPVYLPANGALLAAVAMMAGGWDGASGDAPGFPHDGTWRVRSEGLHPLP